MILESREISPGRTRVSGIREVFDGPIPVGTEAVTISLERTSWAAIAAVVAVTAWFDVGAAEQSPNTFVAAGGNLTRRDGGAHAVSSARWRVPPGATRVFVALESRADITTRVVADFDDVPPPVRVRGHNSVAYDDSVIATGAGVSTLGVSITVANNADRCLVGVGFMVAGTAPTLTSSTWGADAMTEHADANGGVTFIRGAVSRLINPAAATRTMTMNFSATADECTVTAFSLFDVDQTTPLTTAQFAGNSSGAATIAWISCACATNGMAIGACLNDTTAITAVNGIPEFISSGALSVATAQTSRTPAAPANRQMGDLEVATCSSENNATHSWSGTGWTKGGQQNSGASFTVSWGWRIYDGSNVDPTISWTGSADASARRHAFRDAQASGTPVVTHGTVGTGTGATHTSTGANTTEADVLAIYLDTCNANTAMAAETSWTERTDSGSATGPIRTYLADREFATSGTATGNISETGGAAAWVQQQYQIFNSLAGDQTQREEVENFGPDVVSVNIATEAGDAFNQFGWTMAGTNFLAMAFGVNEATTTNLLINDATHGHLSDNLALTQANTLVVNDARHTHTADNLVLTQANVLVVNDALHGHTVDNLTVVFSALLAMQDALHGHLSDNLTLTQANILGVNDALHAHLSDNLSLTQANVLVVADARHTHTVDTLALIQANTLAIQDALHGHMSDNLTLTLAGDLAVQDATHAHAADNLVLTQANLLTVQDALHGHSVESIALVQANLLAISDAMHAHFADNVELTQANVLIVNDALHAHFVDMLTLSIITTEPIDPGSMFMVPFEQRIFVLQTETRIYAVVPESRVFPIN